MKINLKDIEKSSDGNNSGHLWHARHFRQSKTGTGFTLLEIMVSMAIMAIALVTIIQLFSGTLRSAKVSKDYSLAIIEAKKKMDRIIAVENIDEVSELSSEEEFLETREGYNYEIIGPDEFELPEGLRQDVEDKNADIETLKYKLYKIGVKVTWGVKKEVSFTTIKMLKEEE